MSGRETDIRKIALLVSCATILQILESLFPHPIPGVRLGLANMITLVALVDLGFRPALEIALLRSVISSFILGTFLSPPFVLSFGAAMSSTLVMGFLFKLSTIGGGAIVSLVGISMIGAMTHNVTQIALAYLLIIHHPGIFYLVPLLGISAVATGWITGIVASQVCLKLRDSRTLSHRQSANATPADAPGSSDPAGPSFRTRGYVDVASPVHALPAVVKMLAVVALAVAVLFVRGPATIIALFLALAGITLLSRVPLARIATDMRRVSSFVLFSFAVPLLFMRDGEPIASLGPLVLTKAGLAAGGTIACRLTLLMSSATLLVATTSPDELAAALRKTLAPLKPIGVPSDRLVEIMTISWQSIPAFWDRIRLHVRNKRSEGRKLREVVGSLSDVIIALYRESEEAGTGK